MKRGIIKKQKQKILDNDKSVALQILLFEIAGVDVSEEVNINAEATRMCISCKSREYTVYAKTVLYTNILHNSLLSIGHQVTGGPTWTHLLYNSLHISIGDDKFLIKYFSDA